MIVLLGIASLISLVAALVLFDPLVAHLALSVMPDALAMAASLLVLGPHLVEGLGGAMMKGFRASPKVTSPDTC